MITHSAKQKWQQKEQWGWGEGGDREVGLGEVWTKFEKGVWGVGNIEGGVFIK